jgi:hypothetical protein
MRRSKRRRLAKEKRQARRPNLEKVFTALRQGDISTSADEFVRYASALNLKMSLRELIEEAKKTAG